MRGRTHKLGSKGRGSEKSAGNKQEEGGAGLTVWGAGTEGVRGQQAANKRNQGQDSQPGEQGAGTEVSRQQTEGTRSRTHRLGSRDRGSERSAGSKQEK